MNHRTWSSLVLAFALTFYPLPASSQAKPCAGALGTARTACLRAEGDRTRRESEKANQKLQRLETAIKVACAADMAAGIAAGAAGKVVAGTAGGVAARGAYVAGKAVGNAATGQRSQCTKQAQ